MQELLRTIFHTLELAVVIGVVWVLLHFGQLDNTVNLVLMTLASAAITKYAREIGVIPDNPNVCIPKKPEKTDRSEDA